MTTMQIAFFKHALLAGLVAALLALLASPAASSAQTTGEATGTAQTSGGAAPAPTSPPPGKLTRATWYGPGFYGHKTACGQKLTRKLVGVASRTLPCGTLVRISYRGHDLTAPVLDRGPFGNGATWDLTAGAARALEIRETVRIGTQIVGSVPNSPTLGEPLTTTLSPDLSPAEASPAPLASSSAATGGASAS